MNGAGKSTLSRLLAGTEAPSCGQRVLGHQVVLDFYAQQQTDKLTTERSVYQEIASGAAFDVVPQLRTLLGAFLFSGEAVDKPVAVLSGGEKSRLVLAKMLLQASNFLILDEPTNHLDLRTKEVLKQALQQFSGTFVLVSHDRDFLDGLVTKVIELQDGRLVSYPGSFEAFVARKEREAGAEGKVKRQMAKVKWQRQAALRRCSAPFARPSVARRSRFGTKPPAPSAPGKSDAWRKPNGGLPSWRNSSGRLRR